MPVGFHEDLGIIEQRRNDQKFVFRIPKTHLRTLIIFLCRVRVDLAPYARLHLAIS